MPIARRYEVLNRFFGRVGPRAEAYDSPKIIAPTIDAELYDPSPWFGTDVDQPAGGVGNINNFFVEVPNGTTLTDIRIHSPFNLNVFLWVWSVPSGSVATTNNVPAPLTNGAVAGSVTRCQESASVPIASRPANSLQLRIEPGATIWLQFPVRGPAQLQLSTIALNAASHYGLWWREVQPIT